MESEKASVSSEPSMLLYSRFGTGLGLALDSFSFWLLKDINRYNEVLSPNFN